MDIIEDAFKLSFEFFPPNTAKGEDNLISAAQDLSQKKPEYFSVTFGAGGSTQRGTFKAANLLLEQTDIDIAPHISSMGQSKADILTLLNAYQEKGMKRLVVLRGDLPSGMGMVSGDFKYAIDLLDFIRSETKDYFTIDVAAYPEVHPEARSPESDFQFFKEKVEAGANSVITQYFYNIDAYIDFVERCDKANLNVDIVPGIMPILNGRQLINFSERCGADIPIWLKKRLIQYESDQVSSKAFAEEVVTRLCDRLLAMNAPGLHFYTLNRSEASLAICHNLGI